MNRVGTVYGQGLYALARDEGLEEEILQQLQVLDGCFQTQPEYLKLLSLRNLTKEERADILEEAFRDKLHIYVLNFLKLLTDKGYIRHFSDCRKAYKEQYNADRGILEVQTLSAITLTESQKQRLTDKLTAITGKQIELLCRVEPSLLGGILLSYDGKQVDGSVKGRLEVMEKQLKNTVL